MIVDEENTLPEQVQAFVAKVRENGATVPGWDEDMVAELLYIDRKEDGSITVCDNFERYFTTIYTYTADGKWLVRSMWGGGSDRPYTYEKAMSDASIMYTG